MLILHLGSVEKYGNFENYRIYNKIDAFNPLSHFGN